jgi:hypothetical protein
MYLTVHTAIGGAASQITSSPLIAFVLGVILHFMFDMVPHGDEWIKKIRLFRIKSFDYIFVILTDFILTIITALIWIKFTPIDQISLLFAGIAGGAAPDALWGFYEMTKSPSLAWYKKFHTNVHQFITKKTMPTKKGFVLQFVILAIASILIIFI